MLMWTYGSLAESQRRGLVMRMMRLITLISLLITQISFLVGTDLAFSQEVKLAHLGDLQVQSGETIHDCQLGYITFGQLNATKSNAILFPMWALGMTAQGASLVGPGKLLDSSKYYVILVDPLANGISSSPSNSKLQPRMHFPRITIGDMVNAEHELVIKTLRLDHLKAVIGMSMGGMQTFQWMVAYPEFMDIAVPIVGSPRLAPYDLLLWHTEIDLIKSDPKWNNGDYDSNPANLLEAEVGTLTLSTPEHFNAQTTRAQVAPILEAAAKLGSDANNRIRQLEAMIAMDVSETFGGSMDKAAAHVKAKAFVIVSKRDHTVTPQPALDFAKLLHAETLVIDSDCGHGAPFCEAGQVSQRVNAFLQVAANGTNVESQTTPKAAATVIGTGIFELF